MTLQELKKICKKAVKCPELDPTLKPEIALALIAVVEAADTMRRGTTNGDKLLEYDAVRERLEEILK